MKRGTGVIQTGKKTFHILLGAEYDHIPKVFV